MKQKQWRHLFLAVLLVSFFSEIWIHKLHEESTFYRLNEKTIQSNAFRHQMLNEDVIDYLDKKEMTLGKITGLYLLENYFEHQAFSGHYSKDAFTKMEEKWKKRKEWKTYIKYCNAIWEDLRYFPIPSSTTDHSLSVSFLESFMQKRTYGGSRGHEGTDIMATRNEPGLYPVVSMTNGRVLSKGWLEKGGYRLLIQAPKGACFYYAHLDSYAKLEIGDEIQAGDVIGFMGDTGYGAEGTRGKFPVHLHVGCYIYPEGNEVSINPYWLLKYLEKHKLKCAYS